MAKRFSRSEKEKWVSSSKSQPRRNPVVIPESNTSSLIEENKFTLIGRITNPRTQNTRALVDFFLQHWSVVGQFTGRDLGPHLFQFKFESERDLLEILKKGPFHFKRWMVLLQRWEPIVSDDFPSDISFWIKIHGIPLHYWTDGALHAIGSDLGVVETKDVDQGRVRVRIKGLKPLEMQLDITLPSSGTKKVELHYEKLEKHCFLCHSLSHEESECSQRNAPAVNRTSSRGINHAQTIESLESYRRARDDRKIERGRFVEASRREADYHRRRSDIHQRTQVNHRRSPPRVANHNDQMRGSSAASLGTRITARNPQNTTASPRLSASQRISHGQPSAHSRLGERVWVEKGSQAQYSHTPPPNPPREAMYANQEVDSTQNRRQIAHRLQLSDERGVLPPVGDLDSSSQERRSVLHRIETTGTRALTPVPSGHAMAAQERLPALQRLAPSPTERVPLLRNGVANSDSGRLQDVAVHYLEDTFPLTLLEGSGKPSSSRVPAVERLSRPQISPIRGLSEDRRQVEHTRDAPQQSEDGDPSYLPPATAGTSSRKGKGVVLTSNGKGKVAENDLPQPRKRTTRTPLQGVSLKKRRVTKTVHSPKRRPTTGNTQPAKGSRGVNQGARSIAGDPPITLIPAITRSGKDFRSGPSTLP